MLWREDMERRRLAGGTIRSYDSSLRYFLEWITLRRMSVLDVGARELLDYLDELRADEATSDMGTIAARFTAINSLYDYLALQDFIPGNFVPAFRHRYLKAQLSAHNKHRVVQKRMSISVPAMRGFLRSISDLQERVIIVLLCKTGVRVSELVAIDVAEIDWKGQTIFIKPHPKRRHPWVMFDEEAARLLRKWLSVRSEWTTDADGPLLLDHKNARMPVTVVGHTIRRLGRRVGLHKDHGEKHEKLGPHVFRHWYTTQLRRDQMPPHYLQALRGDAIRETIDVYTELDLNDVRKAYLKRMPLIVGQRKNPAEWKRARRAENASFGGLTREEAARPAGLRPGPVVLELRRRIMKDTLGRGVKRPAEYVEWLVVERGMKLTTARPLVSQQLKTLGFPPLHRGARSKEGWKLRQQELKEHFTGKRSKRRKREKRGRV